MIGGPISGGGQGGGDFDFETHPRPGRPGRPGRPSRPDFSFGDVDPTDVLFRPVFHNPFFNGFGFGEGSFGGLFPGFDLPQRIPWWKG